MTAKATRTRLAIARNAKRAARLKPTPAAPAISAETFKAWLAMMTLKRIALTDAEAAALLGVHKNTLSRWKRDGAPLTVALACWALDNKGYPWKIEHPF